MLLRANALAKGYSGARIETVELLIECLNRGVLPRVPGARLGGRERRPRSARPSRAAARRRGPGVVRGHAPPGRRGARRGRARAGAARGQGGPVADQRHAVHGRDGLARARAGVAAGADRRSRLRALARVAAGLAHELPSRDPPGAAAARAARLGRQPAPAARGLGDHRVAPAGATGSRTPTRSAARRRCTARAATCSTHVEATVAVELNAATDNPLVLVDEGLVVSNGNFHGQPLAFALDALAMAVSELASISERRVERLVNPSLSEGLPPFLTARRRPQQRLHDPAVRGRGARLGEQVALPPGERRLDPDERGPGGSRLDGERRRPEGAAGAREQRARARDRAARRRAGDRVPRAARAGAGRARGARRRARAVRARARRPLALGGHRARRRRDRDGSILAAAESAVGELR